MRFNTNRRVLALLVAGLLAHAWPALAQGQSGASDAGDVNKLIGSLFGRDDDSEPDYSLINQSPTSDFDEDGVPDINDAFPANPDAYRDQNGDGVPD